MRPFAALPFAALLSAALAVAATLSPARVLAQGLTTFAAPIAVGGSSPSQAVTVTLQKTGTVASVNVLTLGVAGLDFVPAPGGSCAVGATYTAGQTCTVNVGFSPLAPGQRRGAVVLRTSAGATLSTQYLAGSATGSLGVFVPGTLTTVVGDTSWIYAGDGVAATSASIFLPFGFAIDAAENLYIADQGNNRIREVSGSTGLISTIAGDGFVGATGDGGLAVNATVSSPTSVALDSAGNIYFSDSGNNVVRTIDAGTGIIATVAGTMGAHGYSGDGGPATAATLNTPDGIAIDTAGNLYIADNANNVVRKVNAQTGIITTIAGTGAESFSGDGGLATAATFNAPWGVTVAPGGQIYIADQNNNRIRMIATNGIVSTIAGNGQNVFSGDNGPATAASLNVPASTVVDVAGNIYVADSGNNRVRKINATTGVITTIAGGGSAGTGDNGPATLAGIYGPYMLALDSSGSLLIADVFDNRIRKVSSNVALLEYSAIRVGRVSPAQTETLENDGNAPLAFSAFTAVSDSQVDLPSTTCSLSTLLPSLSSCAIGADFAPTTTGNPVYGSVSVVSNAANAPATLNLEGQVLDIDPTTITLTASANPANYGATITFAVSVTSAGSTPTGTVTLLDSATAIASGSLNSGGNVSFPVSSLSVGTHNITASYSGDSSNAASISAPVVEVIRDSTAPTTTTLIASANPAQAGARLTFTATVSVPAIDEGNGSASGTIAFSDGSTVLGTGTLKGGIATFTTTGLAVGTHSIVATYPGVTGFGPSVSAPLAVTVQLATSSAIVASSANPAIGGAPLTLTAILSSTGGTPTGSVSFLDGTTLLGKATLNGAGSAVLVLPGSTLAVGTHSLSVAYAGDADDSTCASAPLSEVVDIATTSTVVASSANPAYQGALVTLSATVSSTGGTPTGLVQFFDGSTSLGSGTLNASGAATLSISTLALGSHSIAATYAGDALDKGSASAALAQVVQAASATVTLASTANPGIYASAVTFNIDVAGNGSVPTGTVTLMDGTVTLTTLPLTGTGVVTYTTSALALGAHLLVAQYSGDANHAAANSSTLTENIIQATTTTLTQSTAQTIAGTSVTLQAAVTGSAGQTVAGNVNFSDGGNPLATVALDAAGTATYTSSALAVGVHTLAAAYTGNSLNQASTSSPLTQRVLIATTVTALTTSVNPAFTGNPVTFTATVAGNGGTPTGSVSFLDGTAVLKVVPLTGTTAAYTVSNLSAGNHEIVASYAGDANDSPSSSASITQKIQQQSTVTLTSSANPSLLENNVTISVTVANGVPTPPTGTVTLTDGSTAVGTATLSAAGTATFTLTAPSLGTHTLTATYSGDTQNLPATSPALAQVVTLRPTTASFTVTANALSAGQLVTFIAVVQGTGPTPPTGTVAFTAGPVQLGTATVTSDGLATLTFVPAQGSYAVVANYPGDALYAASTSAPIAVVVGPPTQFDFTMTPSSLSVQSGQHGTIAIAIDTAATFSDTLALGCAGLPQYATCTFSANQIAVGKGVPASLTVTLDTADPLGSGSQSLNRPALGTGVFACAIPGGVLAALLLWRSRRRTGRLSGLLALVVLAAGIAGLGATTGCGSSFQGPTVAPGSYTFKIIGTGNATGATQTGSVALTVTQ